MVWFTQILYYECSAALVLSRVRKNVFDECHDTSEIVEMLKELMYHVNMIDAKLDTKADSEAVAVLDQQLQ